MADYSIHEIFNRVCEIINDGYHYVNIMELESNDDFPSSLEFSAYDPKNECSINYDSVDALESEELFQDGTIHADEFLIGITSKETSLLKVALEVTLSTYKEMLSDSSIEKNQKDKIKSLSVELRNMQARINHTLKVFQST